MNNLDLICSLTLLSIAIIVGVGFAMNLLSGRARSFARVEADGGSPLLGRNTMNAVYWMMEPPLAACEALGLKPDGVTLISLALAVGAGVAFGMGHFGVGALLSVVSALGDLLDGQLARRLNLSSRRGALLDSSVDRVGESAFFGGVAVAYRHELGWLVLALVALQGAYLVSYVSSKAESLDIKTPRGFMRRSERATYLLTAAAFVPMVSAVGEKMGWSPVVGQMPMLVALTLIAVLANVSAVQRLLFIWRALSSTENPPSIPPVGLPAGELAGVGPSSVRPG